MIAAKYTTLFMIECGIKLVFEKISVPIEWILCALH